MKNFKNLKVVAKEKESRPQFYHELFKSKEDFLESCNVDDDFFEWVDLIPHERGEK